MHRPSTPTFAVTAFTLRYAPDAWQAPERGNALAGPWLGPPSAIPHASDAQGAW